MERRSLLRLAGIAFTRGVLAAQQRLAFNDYDPAFRIESQKSSPRIRCFDLRELTTLHTPASSFFLFHQGAAAPVADLMSWRLIVEGAVARPRVFTFEDLSRQARIEVDAVLECAGNSGHSRLMNGLVSNGRWSGVPLAPLLRECGVLSEAREVVFFGADSERESKWPAAGREYTVPHGRSLFVQDALEGNAMLAMQLNGEPLRPEHGYPLRLLMPGWYGMTQIKWLNRIVVLDRRYEGRHMARNYHSLRLSGGDAVPMETSISRNRLKSVVARVDGDSVFSGAAWGGAHPIHAVEVRMDNGPWRKASIVERGGERGWLRWRFQPTDIAPGVHTIVSRAVDARGNVQPEHSEMLSAREENSQWPRRVIVA